ARVEEGSPGLHHESAAVERHGRDDFGSRALAPPSRRGVADDSGGDKVLSGIVLARLPDILGRLAAWIHLLASASRRAAGADIDLTIAAAPVRRPDRRHVSGKDAILVMRPVEGTVREIKIWVRPAKFIDGLWRCCRASAWKGDTRRGREHQGKVRCVHRKLPFCADAQLAEWTRRKSGHYSMPPGRVDKSHERIPPDAARCDSTLIFMWEISGDPRRLTDDEWGFFEPFVTEGG